MASTSEVIRYEFNFLLLHGEEPSEAISGQFTTASGVTDEIVIAFARAFRDLPWGPGINTVISVEKQTVDTASSTANIGAGTFS